MFLITVLKKNNNYYINLSFKISLSIKDYKLIKLIKNHFNIGNYYIRKNNNLSDLNIRIDYVVNSIDNIKVIIDHFNKYPLLTNKFNNFEIFKKVYNIILKKEHLTNSGLKK